MDSNVSKVTLTVMVFLAYHLTDATVTECGANECSNNGQMCPDKRDKVCVNGMCRTCFCSEHSQCFMEGGRDGVCNCSHSEMGGKYCNCTECENCDDVFGFSKPCKRYTTDFSCESIDIIWLLDTERMHAAESFTACKDLCVINEGCKIFSWKPKPKPTCYWYEPVSLIVNNIEIPVKNKGSWLTCFKICEFC